MRPFALILASGSPRRRELLRSLGLSFEVLRPADGVEPVISDCRTLDQAALAVEASARAKALAVAQAVQPAPMPHLILGADTVVRYGRHTLGKPHNSAEAAAMLRRLSGRWHYVLSGLCVCQDGGASCRCAHSITRVLFRQLSEAEIAAYVATGLPLDKAGAYGIQDMASIFVQKIDGCYFNVMGLPLQELDKLLKTFDYRVLG